MAENPRLLGAAHRIHRRVLLRALGLGMALPAAMRVSSMALATPTARPKRFLLFFMPHGVPPEHYGPTVNAGDPTDFSLEQNGVSILGPLEPYKALVNVLRGFSYPGAMTHEGVLSCLSGITTFAGGVADETTPRTTLEHVIANGLGVRPLILGAVPHRQWGLDKDGKLMWDGQAVVPEKNPLKAYDEVFGGLSEPSGPDPDVALREALVTLTSQEIAALQTELSGLTSEQTKLQTHLESLESLKASTGSGPVSCTTAPQIDAVEALRTRAQGQTDDFFLSENNFGPILEAQLALAANAILCNAAQVVAVQPLYVNCDIDFSFVPGATLPNNGGSAHHSALSHTQPSLMDDQSLGMAVSNMEMRTPFATAQRWFSEKLVEHVVSTLSQEDPADPGRTVLDNTIIYWMSEIGEGAAHTSHTEVIQRSALPGPTTYLPLVTIGGGGGALRTGQVITLPTDRPAGDIYLSLCRAMGVEGASFSETTGPLTEILA